LVASLWQRSLRHVGTATTAADAPALAFHLVIVYGIASAKSGDVQDWYTSREEAERVLAGILRDEPDFEGELWVEAVEFDVSRN
jgi:hypothetical protein